MDAGGLIDYVPQAINENIRMKTLAIMAVVGVSFLAQHAPASASVVKSAKLIDRNPTISAWEVGDIQVTYTDGRKETITHDHTCGRPKVSDHGYVGWSVWIDHTSEPKYSHSGEILRVQLPDGTIRNFHPNGLFIQNWVFAGNGHAVVIAAMEHHGPESYIEYDLRSGQELGRVNGYVPYDQLPGWAKPVSDDAP